MLNGCVLLTSFLFILQVSSDDIISARLLKFIPVNETDLSRPVIHYSIPSKDKPVTVDAAYRTQVSIFASSRPDISAMIKIFCSVAQLSSLEPIISRRICRRGINDDGTLQKESHCQNVLDGQHIFNQFLVSSHPNGFVMTRDKKVKESDYTLSASYSCRLGNKYGNIESNWFHIVDSLDKQRAVIARNNGESFKPNKVEIVKPIEANSLPFSFDCFHRKIQVDQNTLRQPQYGSLLRWAACRSPVTVEPASCLDAMGDVRKAYLEDIGEHVTLSDGTLWLLSLKITSPMALNLVCYSEETRGQGFNYFYGKQRNEEWTGFLLQPGANYDGPIEIKSSEFQNILFEPRHVKEKRFPYELTAIYKAPKTISYEWKKDNRSLPTGFTHTWFKLEFPAIVDDSLEGMYSLWLNNTLYFQYNVSIMTIPYFLNAKEIVEEIFVMDGGSVKILYNVSHSDHKKTIYINGNEIPFDGSQSLRSIITRSYSQHKTLYNVKNLKAELSILDGANFDKSTQLQYQVTNLQDTGKGDLCESHTFSMYVENEYGGSRVDSMIKVLPKPIPVTNQCPRHSSCDKTDCHPQQSLTIRCTFQLQLFRQEGVHPLLLWYLNDHLLGPNVQKIPVSANHTDTWNLNFENDREMLIIKNLSSSITNANVTCRLLLLHPDIRNVSDYSTFDFTKHSRLVIFDSKRDSYLHKEIMTAKIFLIQTDMASFWLLLGPCLVILVIIIVLVVLVILRIKIRRKNEKKKRFSKSTAENVSISLHDSPLGANECFVGKGSSYEFTHHVTLTCETSNGGNIEKRSSRDKMPLSCMEISEPKSDFEMIDGENECFIMPRNESKVLPIPKKLFIDYQKSVGERTYDLNHGNQDDTYYVSFSKHPPKNAIPISIVLKEDEHF